MKCRLHGTTEAPQCQDCNFFTLTKVETKDKLPRQENRTNYEFCTQRNEDDCYFYYTYEANKISGIHMVVAEKPGEEPRGQSRDHKHVILEEL